MFLIKKNKIEVIRLSRATRHSRCDRHSRHPGRVWQGVCGQRGRDMTVSVAISNQVGVAYYEVGWGGLTAGVFREFLTSLGVVLGDEPATVVMDNAPAHRGAELADSIQSTSWRHTGPF